MALLELIAKEVWTLKNILELHIHPCEDCSPDRDCGVYESGFCITKNVESILPKVREIEEDVF